MTERKNLNSLEIADFRVVRRPVVRYWASIAAFPRVWVRISFRVRVSLGVRVRVSFMVRVGVSVRVRVRVRVCFRLG
jgi:hypothetical protein